MLAWWRVWFFTVLFFFIFFSSPFADELNDLKNRLEKQQHEIDQLRQTMERMEGKSGDVEHMEAAKPMFGANLGIFGDTNFSTRGREQSKDSFYLGDIDLYSTGNFGNRLTFLSEILIETKEQGFELDVERLLIGYTFNDLLTVKAGRQHTALGYWNKTYHHGKQLFLSIDRPFFMKFEDDGGILPVHINGMEFEGRWGYGFARFKYELEVGNGPSILQSTGKLATNSASDDNNSKQIVLRISGHPSDVTDLNIGVSGTAFTIDTNTKANLDERIYGIDIAYAYHGIDFLTEYFRLINSDAAGDAFYIQLAHHTTENLTPYTRFESLNADTNDPYLRNLIGGFSRRQIIAGIKYDIDVVRSSIKTQYRYDDAINGSDYNVFEMQWSFGF